MYTWEFNNILKRISENPSVRDLSRETDDLTMNVNCVIRCPCKPNAEHKNVVKIDMDAYI